MTESPIRVTAAVILHDGMLLIAKRKPTGRLPNLWELPGGKIEPGETPEACLKRELKEEFDIEAGIKEHIGTHTYTYDFGTVELLAYRANWDDGHLVLNDHEEIHWVFAHELDQFEFAPADAFFVAQLRTGEIEFDPDLTTD